EVIGELIVFEDVGAKAQIHRGDLRVGGLDGEGGDLRLGREIGAHLVDAGADVGERIGGREVELEAYVDGRQALRALRLDVVDAVGGADGAVEQGDDEAAHEIGVDTQADGLHRVGGALDARILPHDERSERLQAAHQDENVHHDGEHR